MEQTKFASKIAKLQARQSVEIAQKRDKIQFFQFPETGVTVAAQRTGPEMIAFAVAIASPDESKFRKLIGKVKALERFDNGAMPAVCPADMLEAFAQDLAYLVG